MLTLIGTCKHLCFATSIITLMSGAEPAVATDAADCQRLPGTYVTTITDIEGVFASRSIISFLPGGGVLITDSRQGGQEGVYQPFSAGQGHWSCHTDDGKLAFTALSLTFSMPHESAASSFGRVDYKGTLDPSSNIISGKLSLRFSSAGDLEGDDPIAHPGEVLETFGFEGRRIEEP